MGFSTNIFQVWNSRRKRRKDDELGHSVASGNGPPWNHCPYDATPPTFSSSGGQEDLSQPIKILRGLDWHDVSEELCQHIAWQRLELEHLEEKGLPLCFDCFTKNPIDSVSSELPLVRALSRISRGSRIRPGFGVLQGIRNLGHQPGIIALCLARGGASFGLSCRSRTICGAVHR
jgi:hypothetical protein